MRGALFVGRKEVLYLLRSRETIFWVFVMPVVFFFFIGNVTGGMGRGGGKQRVVLEAPADAALLSDRLQRHLEEQDFVVDRVEPGEAGSSWRRLVLPVGVMDSLAAGRQAVVRFVHGSEGLGGDYDVMRAGRATYTLVADLVAAAAMSARADSTAVLSDSTGLLPSAAALARLDSLPRALTLEVAAAGHRREIPVGFQQAVPGILVMFILLVMGTSGAVMLVQERRQGLLRRLAAAPLSRRQVVLGKWGGKLALGLVQVAFAMVLGSSPLFRVDWGPDLPMVALVLAVYAALAAGIGLLLGALARTEGQAVAVGVIAANALGALGGCWWPIEIAPRWMQGLQLFLPTGWAMDALHRLMSYQAGAVAAVPHVLGMAAATLILLGASSRLFRYE